MGGSYCSRVSYTPKPYSHYEGVYMKPPKSENLKGEADGSEAGAILSAAPPAAGSVVTCEVLV